MERLAYFFAFFILKFSIATEPNNVCKTFNDYRHLSASSNCWYNPDVTATTPELVTSHDYPLETYEAITKDNYILTIFRIPPRTKTPKGIVLLMHPAMCSSSVWSDLGNQSLSFLLSDAGYDVWMGNYRGTIYSPYNVNISQKTDPNQYWNFTFHEFGIYDMPTHVDLVRKETNYKKKIIFIGHSAATTASLIYASLLPSHAKNNTGLFIQLAPVAFMEHEKGILKLLYPIPEMLLKESTNGLNGLTYDGKTHTSVESFCMNVDIKLCVMVYKWLFGPDRQNIYAPWFPITLYQTFAGYPIKGLIHSKQIMDSHGRFQWFDYGKKQNMYYYHSKKPPLYPIENITVPNYIIYGGHDFMADRKDVLHLYKALPEEARYGIYKIRDLNHMDFLYGKGIKDILYLPLIKLVNEFSVNTTKTKITNSSVWSKH